MIYKKRLTLDDVYHLVYEYFGVDPKILTRKREIVRARQMAMYLMRELDYQPTYRDISGFFGKHDHSFSKHAIEAAEILIDLEYKQAYKDLKDNILSLEILINSGVEHVS